ncbi:umuC protein [Candidatus Dependentiae bacterium Noda2021]|nr:umuC protein [Candidatus Dependentiae bacterium Noda2021]
MSYTQSHKIFFLVDCNNFFVSCERVFNPKLRNRPVVILSSNDGCVISRSQEAKALEIPMGAPYFEYEKLFKKHNVAVHSSNFALYADMSARVMSVLGTYTPHLEVYSVDEAFLVVPLADRENILEYAQQMRYRIYQTTGIPVSIGIGPTKTLAKLANSIAKKGSFVYQLIANDHLPKILATLSANEVWGIGRRYTKFLQSQGIQTALDLKNLDHQWARKQLTISGLKTVLELNGISCLDVNDDDEVKKTITVSRMFGKKITDKNELHQAITEYTTSALQKLRQQGSLATRITVFAMASAYHDSTKLFYNQSTTLPCATAYTPDFITAAKQCIDRLYKQTLLYKKVGVTISEFVPLEFRQLSMYDAQVYDAKKEHLMSAVDSINSKWGKKTVFYAAAGINQQWWAKSLKRTPCYTTSWQELPKVKCR